MTTQLSPLARQKFFNNDGAPLVSGLLYTYQAGTNNPQVTYTDSTQTTQNTNPIVLDTRGECALWLNPALNYKLALTDAIGNQIPGYPVDNINGQLTANTSIIPTQDNTYALGSSSFAWSQLYLGANHAPTLDLNSGIVGYIPQSAAEAAASVVPVKYGYAPFDIRRYGGDPTGVATSDAALTAALAVCGTAGGTIRFPGIGGAAGSNYTFANQYSLSQRHGIIFQGDGGPTSSNTNGTYLTYTGTASPWFSIPNASGILFKNMTLAASNAGFSTGTYIKGGAVSANPAAFCGLDDVCMGSSTSTGAIHLDLDQTILFSAKRCIFQFGGPSVKGQAAAGGSYSILISFKNCQWSGTTNAAGGSVYYGGDTWDFDSCDFESLTGGAVGGFGSNSSTPGKSVNFKNCWFGDAQVGATGVWITYFGSTLNVIGCDIGGSNASESISLNNVQGANIIGNLFNGALTAIGFDTTTITGVTVTGNSFQSVTNIFGSTANAPTDLVYNPNDPHVTPPSGLGNISNPGYTVNPLTKEIRMWGSKTVTMGTPLAITFLAETGLAFPTNLFAINVSLDTPGASITGVVTTTSSKTGTTLTLTGTGTNTALVYWQATGD